ncbi:MAG TPA: M20/M25/M40 family metallo-hydrolase [Trueperaceae bacterium]|nr:M20/M25/M40 family metallo-hydrolase [Trueperaceae bacterium]
MPVTSPLELARELVRTPSPSGREGAAAAVLLGALRQLGFDRTYVDEVGNAIGVVLRGSGPTLLLTGHLDTVDPGDPDEWPHPPLEGVVADGRLWGRGTVDMKAALACMAVGAAAAAAEGFGGTLVVAGVVQEEVNGIGSMHLAATLDYDLAVLGEPSDLRLKLGHKGRVEVLATFTGAIAHAARPELGENALLAASRYVAALERLELPASDVLGAATATPTGLRTSPGGTTNVVPGSAELVIDVRTLPGQGPDEVLALLASAAPDDKVAFSVPASTVTRPDGTVEERPHHSPAYLVGADHVAVETARAALQRALRGSGRQLEEGVWWFCTDAPHLALGGRPVIGFGPGEEELAHTTRESVAASDLDVAARAYRELALAYLGGRP